MSMLGSPIAGVPYLFVDPASVWARAGREESDRQQGMSGDERGLGMIMDPGQPPPSVTLLLPTEQHLSSSRKSSFPAAAAQRGGVIPQFKIQSTIRLPAGQFELYAIDAWVLDRTRKIKCVIVCGGTEAEGEGEGEGDGGMPENEKRDWHCARPTRIVVHPPFGTTQHDDPLQSRGGGGGVLVDEYTPLSPPPASGPRLRRRRHRRASGTSNSGGGGGGAGDAGDSCSEDREPAFGRAEWMQALEAFEREVEADGGRLLEVQLPATEGAAPMSITHDVSAAHYRSSQQQGYRRSAAAAAAPVLLPIIPLPYLAYGLHPIHVPDGSYKDVKERLWVNLNLRRFGCSGRSSVGLEPPSPATQHKFLTQYRLPPPLSTETGEAISCVVLELVRLVQTALFLHGLYGNPEGRHAVAAAAAAAGVDNASRDLDEDERRRGRERERERGWEYVDEPQDGLLCDSTMLAFGIWRTGVQMLDGGGGGGPSVVDKLRASATTGDGGWGEEWGMEEGEWDELCTDPGRRRVRVDGITDEFTSQGPNLTAALLSEVVSIRCKLAALDINVPRDPFAKPAEFLHALREYQRAFHSSRPSSQSVPYLTPRLLDEINTSYAKAQRHESTKLSKILKNQVAQASAGFASNLTGLASATLGSATSTGRYHGASDDEGSDREAQEVTIAGGTAEKSSASNLATANIDRWVSCIKSGKEGLGNGRVGDLWLGKVGNGQGRQWPWDVPRRSHHGSSVSPRIPISIIGEKRRTTHAPYTGQSMRDRTSARQVSADLPRHDEPLDRQHAKRHLIHDHAIRESESSRRHKTRASISHSAGQLRSMTSKTGHVLRDGLSNVTSLARKGFEFGDQSDSDPGQPTAGDSRKRHGRRSTTPVMLADGVSEMTTSTIRTRQRDLSLISTDMVSLESNPRYPQISITATAPSDATSSRTSLGPRHLQSRSVSHFADSEAFSEGLSDVISDTTRPQQSTLELSTRANAPTNSSKSSLPFTKLERMVSMNAQFGAVSPGHGIEFLHSGHDEQTWIHWKRDMYQTRGIVRRYSYESMPPPRELVRQHPKQLALDVNACGLVWRLSSEESRLRREVEMLTEMEALMQRISRELVDEFRNRKQLMEQLQSSATTLISPKPHEVDEDLAASEQSLPQSTSGHAQRLSNKLATGGNDLEYSVRNLQNTVRSIGDAASKIDMWMTEFPPEMDDDGIYGGTNGLDFNAPSKDEWTGSVLDNVPGNFISSAGEKTCSDDGQTEAPVSDLVLMPWLRSLRSLWQR